MDLQALMGMQGMGMQQQGPQPEMPQHDTSETIHISSLALLKMMNSIGESSFSRDILTEHIQINGCSSNQQQKQ